MKTIISLALLLLFFNLPATAQEHSATRALTYSILPGGGQIYNRQAWKIPIIYGAFAGTGYFIYNNYTQMKLFLDEYLYRVNHNDQANLSQYAAYSTTNIRSLYNSYNRYFQLSIIVAVGFYALNLIDAYVFGHLFDFKIDDDISLALQPAFYTSPQGSFPTIGIDLTF